MKDVTRQETGDLETQTRSNARGDESFSVEDLGSSSSSVASDSRSSAVNTECPCLGFLTCKVEMKTDATL